MNARTPWILAAGLAALSLPALALESLDESGMAREQIGATQPVALLPEEPETGAPTPIEVRHVDVPAHSDSYQYVLVPREGARFPIDRPLAGSR